MTKTDPARLTARLTPLIVLWALGYGGLRAWWAAGHQPDFAPLGWDLVVFSPWQPVVLCAAAALLAGVLRLAPNRLPALLASGLVVVGIVASCPLVLIDLVSTVLVGLGLPHNLGATASRFGYLAGAVLLTVVAVEGWRQYRGACRRCGRTEASARVEGRVPGWARVGAYLAVVGCLVRFGDQLVAGFGDIPFTPGPAEVAFDAGFLLAGTVLPLATTHTWGRVLPRWTPLPGRRIPRWLVLGPAAVLSGGLTVYFGIALAQLVVDPSGWTGDGRYSLAFYWVAIPAYVLWGLGLGAGALGYRRASRPACRACGRSAAGRPADCAATTAR